MSNFRVTIQHDACTVHDVEAESKEAAIYAAFDEAHVTLCHQCSGSIELADPIRALVVENLATGEYDDIPSDDEVIVSTLRQRVAELEQELARMRGTLSAEALADKCEAWLQLGGATNVVDAFEAGYRACEAHIAASKP